ncbi:helix-turn-helix transcriptional regulator [Treponema brennaborense]|uniref:Regulatory protein, DeoR n=1 Tax=Treponema brennaborense (strain DSM 12168 / CIP 105900 / DD5/3) TaxID=906968 RepID=F4LML7_TREBD|nr:WYL domain-containing protein [Treponema brennaborense]AEE16764.1 regulatory protein, DeoR [Treponema brennaborense DSM 12168]
MEQKLTGKKRDDIRRTTRIIQIDEMLRGGSYIKIDDLIFTFGVNRRTVERDFEHLRDELNAPLEYDKSRLYHYTDPTFSIPNIVLTEGELFTVSTVMPLMEQYKNTPLENSFKSIMTKIVSFLPDTVTVNSSFLNQDVSFISDPLPKIDENIFNSIFKAIRSRTVISFEYKSAGSKLFKNKSIDSYRVLCQKGNWYVLGFDREVQAVRVYALPRIKNIVFEHKTFTVPKDFNVENHIDLNFGIWNNPNQPVEYELLFSPQTSNYVLEREWHKNQQVEQKEDGSVLLKFKSNQSQMIFTWVMSFGDAVMVRKPPELREKIMAECEKMMKKYR